MRRADINRKGPNFFTWAAWSKEPAAAIQSREASIAYSSSPWIKQTNSNFLILCQSWSTLENFERGSCTVYAEKKWGREEAAAELTPELRKADVNQKGPNFFTRAAWSKEPAAAIQSREASIAYSSGPSKKK